MLETFHTWPEISLYPRGERFFITIQGDVLHRSRGRDPENHNFQGRGYSYLSEMSPFIIHLEEIT
jgi:hypothetical protein